LSRVSESTELVKCPDKFPDIRTLALEKSNRN
jgi:hypothetical protein